VYHILVVDDERSIRTTLKTILSYDGYRVTTGEDAAAGLEVLESGDVDLAVLDIKMPRIDGITLLKQIRAMDPDLPVIFLSAHGSVETAVEATKLGAFDFLEKPPDRDKILFAVRNGLEKRRLTLENKNLREEVEKSVRLLGESTQIREIWEIINRVGPTNARVLITGENGTGKELVAWEIWRKSARADKPFIKVNCAAIPEELIESELFGHEKGSFTGAVSRKIGKFEQADGGTLFLDEVGDMSLSAQSKVLRILQEGELERVGGLNTINVDVRVLAATNKDLVEEVEAGRFRDDLFFRLNVVPIRLTPLRDRGEDVALLASLFLANFSRESGFGVKRFADEALARLCSYHWPGNVRELRNFVERTAIMTDAGQITVSMLPPFDRVDSGASKNGASYPPEASTFQEFKELSEAAFLREKLSEAGWNIAATARMLEMQRSNLYKKIEKYGLRPPGED